MRIQRNFGLQEWLIVADAIFLEFIKNVKCVFVYK
jgi:hypothetical protein